MSQTLNVMHTLLCYRNKCSQKSIVFLLIKILMTTCIAPQGQYVFSSQHTLITKCVWIMGQLPTGFSQDTDYKNFVFIHSDYPEQLTISLVYPPKNCLPWHKDPEPSLLFHIWIIVWSSWPILLNTLTNCQLLVMQ